MFRKRKYDKGEEYYYLACEAQEAQMTDRILLLRQDFMIRNGFSPSRLLIPWVESDMVISIAAKVNHHESNTILLYGMTLESTDGNMSVRGEKIKDFIMSYQRKKRG